MAGQLNNEEQCNPKAWYHLRKWASALCTDTANGNFFLLFSNFAACFAGGPQHTKKQAEHEIRLHVQQNNDKLCEFLKNKTIILKHVWH